MERRILNGRRRSELPGVRQLRRGGGKGETQGGGGAEGWVQQSLSLVRTSAKTAFRHIMEGHDDAGEWRVRLLPDSRGKISTIMKMPSPV